MHREWKENYFRKRQKFWRGIKSSTEMDSCFCLATQRKEMEDARLSLVLWEASCDSLVCILCVMSYLLLLQVMGILKHKLVVWAMTIVLSSRDSHLDKITQALHMNKVELGQHSKEKSNTICKVKNEAEQSIKRMQAWKSKVVWGAGNI